MVLNLKTCCCCVDLRAGCLIIGYVSLVSSLATLLYILVESRHLVTDDNINEDTRTGTVMENDDDRGQLTLPMFTIGMVGVIVSLVFIIMLIVGIHKDKPKYVVAYLIYGLISVLSMMFFFATGISTGKPLVAIIVCATTILLTIYFLLVVRSYYLEMRATEIS